MQSLKYRAIDVFLALVFILLIVLNGTYGWQNLGQSANNEFLIGENVFRVELLKLEKQGDGELVEKPIPGAVFYLFTSDKEQIGGRYVTDEEGKISVQLPKGDYYFQEVEPAPGYTFDTQNGADMIWYPFTITGEETETVTVKVYNLREEAALAIRKTVKNADQTELTEAQKQIGFTFTVTFSDGGSYVYSINNGVAQLLESGGTITLRHGETAVFRDLPVGVFYQVTETPVPGYTITSSGSHGNIGKEGNTAEFTNTYDPGLPGSLTVTKEVKGQNADLDKEFLFTLVLDGQTQTFTLKNGGSITFPNLPAGTQYTVTETDYTADGYTASVGSYSGTIVGGQETVLPFVNIYDENPEGKLGTLTLTKEVLGTADPDKVFTFEVTFPNGGTYQYSIDGGEEQTITDGGTLTLKHGQSAVFKDIPHGTIYKIRETDAAGYFPLVTEVTGTIAGDENAQVVFRNKAPDQSVEMVKLRVTKKLAGTDSQAAKEKDFAFIAVIGGEEIKFTLKPDQTKEFDIPKGEQYVVYEEDYYKEGYIQSVVNASGSAGNDVEVIVTNTYIGKEMIEIPGEKKWNLNGYENNILPESITVRLLHDGLVAEEKEVTPDENGAWLYSFNVPKCDGNGNEIQYIIEEAPVKGFITSYDGFNITNTYVAPIKVDPPVVKKIVEGEDAPKTKFDFLMRGESGIPMPENSSGNTKMISLDGAGEAEFGWITFTKAGVYTYTITEISGGAEGWTYDKTVYTMTVTVTEENGVLSAKREITQNGSNVDVAVFTNLYEHSIDLSETILIQGEKRWNHGNNPVSEQPTEIIVMLYADGELASQRMVTKDNEWKYTFEVPRYTADGHEIVYTIGEAEIAGYKMETEGYNLINTYIDPDDPTVDPDDPTVDPDDPTVDPDDPTVDPDDPTVDPDDPTVDPDDPTVDPDDPTTVPDDPNAAPGDPSDPSDPGTDPDTGDSSNVGFWLTLMILSLVGLTAMVLLGGKKVYAGKHSKRSRRDR